MADTRVWYACCGHSWRWYKKNGLGYTQQNEIQGSPELMRYTQKAIRFRPLQLNAALCWVCGSSHQFHHKMSNIWPEIKGLELQFHQHATCCYFTEAVGSDAAPKSGKKNKIWVQLSIHSSCDHAVTKIVFCERQSKKIAGGNAMVTITHRGNIFRIPNWSCAKGDSSLMKAKLSVSEWFKIRFHF